MAAFGLKVRFGMDRRMVDLALLQLYLGLAYYTTGNDGALEQFYKYYPEFGVRAALSELTPKLLCFSEVKGGQITCFALEWNGLVGMLDLEEDKLFALRALVDAAPAEPVDVSAEHHEALLRLEREVCFLLQDKRYPSRWFIQADLVGEIYTQREQTGTLLAVESP
jgi:hypothetical protein